MRKVKQIFTALLLITLVFSCGKVEDWEALENSPHELSITSLVAQGKDLWVGTNNEGLYKFDGKEWTHYTEADGLLSDTIKALLIDNKDDLWIGTNMGLVKFSRNTWTSYTTDDGMFRGDIRSMDCDPDNNLWLGSGQNRLMKFDGSSFTTFIVNPERSNDGRAGHIHSVTCDNDGNVWAGSCMSGLSVYDGSEWTDVVHDIWSFMNASILGHDGSVWVGNMGGAHRFMDGEWTDYTKDNDLPDNMVFCFSTDRDDNIWVGAASYAVKFDGTSWTSYNMDTLLVNGIHTIACDGYGDMWFGGPNGLFMLEE